MNILATETCEKCKLFLPNLLGFSVLNLTYFSDVLTSTLFFCGSILHTFELLVWLRTQTVEAKVQQLIHQGYQILKI